MKTLKTVAVMFALIVGAPMAFTGCDRTVSESTKTVQTPDGTKTDTKTVTQDPNGNVSVTKESSSHTNN